MLDSNHAEHLDGFWFLLSGFSNFFCGCVMRQLSIHSFLVYNPTNPASSLIKFGNAMRAIRYVSAWRRHAYASPLPVLPLPVASYLQNTGQKVYLKYYLAALTVWSFVAGSVCGYAHIIPRFAVFAVPINGNFSPPPRRPSQTAHTDSPSPLPSPHRSRGPFYPRAAEVVVAVAGTASDRWVTNTAIHIVLQY